jgi:hypothetical protein
MHARRLSKESLEIVFLLLQAQGERKRQEDKPI